MFKQFVTNAYDDVLGLTPDAAMEVLRFRSIHLIRAREAGQQVGWAMTYCRTRLNVETTDGLISRIFGCF